jgi:hypothetical protein
MMGSDRQTGFWTLRGIGTSAAPMTGNTPLHSESLLDEGILHFPAIPFLTTLSSQFQRGFSEHRLLPLLGASISSTVLWMPRVRAKSGADQVYSGREWLSHHKTPGHILQCLFLISLLMISCRLAPSKLEVMRIASIGRTSSDYRSLTDHHRSRALAIIPNVT